MVGTLFQGFSKKQTEGGSSLQHTKHTCTKLSPNKLTNRRGIGLSSDGRLQTADIMLEDFFRRCIKILFKKSTPLYYNQIVNPFQSLSSSFPSNDLEVA